MKGKEGLGSLSTVQYLLLTWPLFLVCCDFWNPVGHNQVSQWRGCGMRGLGWGRRSGGESAKTGG